MSLLMFAMIDNEMEKTKSMTHSQVFETENIFMKCGQLEGVLPGWVQLEAKPNHLAPS